MNVFITYLQSTVYYVDVQYRCTLPYLPYLPYLRMKSYIAHMNTYLTYLTFLYLMVYSAIVKKEKKRVKEICR